MTLQVTSSFLLLAVLFLPSFIYSQDRAVTYENSVPFSPETHSFFHTDTQQQNTRNENLYDSSQLDSSDQFPTTASNVQSNLAYESLSLPESGGIRGGMTGIPIGLVFAILLGIGILIVVITRKRNSSEANNAQLNV